MATMDYYVSGHFTWNGHVWELTRIRLYFFELMVAKCFYLSRNVFPSFGYGKRKCVFAVIWPYTWYMNSKVKILGTSGIVRVNITHLYEVLLKHFREEESRRRVIHTKAFSGIVE